jgi:hypothetical protein
MQEQLSRELRDMVYKLLLEPVNNDDMVALHRHGNDLGHPAECECILGCRYPHVIDPAYVGAGTRQELIEIDIGPLSYI